ncbi:MAG: aldolase/citrate lyase family protein [Anaerolineaceae bacterium]|nr:aldolase/citrate lyase family protein [Anaerolineaceae bacterium]
MTGLKGSELKKKIARNEKVFGTFLGITDPTVARMFAQLGFDFLIIDMEHIALNRETVQQMLLMFEGTNTCPIVRVPWHEPVWAKWALDFGAEGIMYPNISSVAAARQVVANSKYPPEGARGFFPRVASNFLMDLPEYLDGINDRIIVWAQIEHKDGVENINEIVKVPGIDALYIGPADLSFSMGILNQYENPVFWDSVERISTAARSAGIPIAYHLYDLSQKEVERVSSYAQIFSFGLDWFFAKEGAVSRLEMVKKITGA